MGDHGLLGILKKHVFQDTNPGDSRFGSQSTSFPGKLRTLLSLPVSRGQPGTSPDRSSSSSALWSALGLLFLG